MKRLTQKVLSLIFAVSLISTIIPYAKINAETTTTSFAIWSFLFSSQILAAIS